jgi:hypothetical protein
MRGYITHQFAHVETLDRATRWLLQIGFQPGQIEVHREGMPWISVHASSDKRSEAEQIFDVAELADPEGWPSFWELSRVPHPHFDPTPESATASVVATVRPSPIGWHPPDRVTAMEDDYGLTKILDVSTRFS